MSLDHVISVKEAAERWGLSAGYVKNLCNKGEVVCKKIGRDWVLDANQANPKEASQSSKMEESR